MTAAFRSFLLKDRLLQRRWSGSKRSAPDLRDSIDESSVVVRQSWPHETDPGSRNVSTISLARGSSRTEDSEDEFEAERARFRLKKELNELSNKLSQERVKNSEANSTIRLLNEELTQKSTQLRAMQCLREQLKEELTLKNGLWRAATARIQALEEQLREFEKTREFEKRYQPPPPPSPPPLEAPKPAASSAAGESKEEEDAYDAALVAENRKIEALERSLKTKEQLVQEIQQKLDHVTSSFEERLQHREQCIGELEGQNRQLLEDVETFQMKLRSAKQTIAETEDQFTKRFDMLSTEKEAVMNKLNVMETEKNNFQAELEQAKLTSDEQTQNIHKLETALRLLVQRNELIKQVCQEPVPDLDDLAPSVALSSA